MSEMADNKKTSGLSLVAKIAIILALVVTVVAVVVAKKNQQQSAVAAAQAAVENQASPMAATAAASTANNQALPSPAPSPPPALPKLVDLGAGKCIPCKMMAPILEELKKEYAGKMEVVFIDVWENKDAGEQYGIQIIPTQIFYDTAGKELFRHEGFFSKEDILRQWKKLGVELGPDQPTAEAISRLEPLQPDTRPAEAVCYMCDGDVSSKTAVTIKTDKGDVHLCSPHCYFITYTSLTDKAGSHERAQVTDWATGQPTAALTAHYLIGQDERHRPTVKAFADQAAARQEMQTAGGNLADWQALEDKELANRCGFCDRANYPEDAARVQVESLSTWGCCPMCALGVAARLQKDITVEQKDALSGELVRVTTLNGSVADLEPKTAVAWAGQKKGPDGKLVSAGCFKQAFFANADNLRKWVELHPMATGQQITINQALAEKMKLSSEQIAKACKIGECAPK